jgi:hypothetical protein
VEATNGASRAARGSAERLAAHGKTGNAVAREERRGRGRHPSRGKSGPHVVRGGGQPVQDDVRVSGMDGLRNLSARHEANNFTTCIPLKAAACVANYVYKTVA